jgi:hypothetical protein
LEWIEIDLTKVNALGARSINAVLRNRHQKIFKHRLLLVYEKVELSKKTTDRSPLALNNPALSFVTKRQRQQAQWSTTKGMSATF